MEYIFAVKKGKIILLLWPFFFSVFFFAGCEEDGNFISTTAKMVVIYDQYHGEVP